MSVLRSYLLALLAVTPAVASARPPDDGGEEKTASHADEKAPTTPASPWKLGTSYGYSWRSRRDLVGRTTFKVETEPSSDAGFSLKSNFEFEKDSTKLEIERRYVFDRRWSLLRYESTSNVSATGRLSSTKATGRLDGRKFVTETIHNEREDRKTRSALRLPGGRVHVLLAQAMELWAVYGAQIFPAEDGTTIQVAYPYFDRVYSVKLSVVGEESLRLGKELVECRRYHLESKEKQIKEDVWVDGQGRVLRYRKGDLTIELQSTRPDKDAGERGG